MNMKPLSLFLALVLCLLSTSATQALEVFPIWVPVRPALISFDSEPVIYAREGTTVSLPVVRSGGGLVFAFTPLKVAIEDGTAQAGSDYLAPAVLETTVGSRVSITILDPPGTPHEPVESFTVSLRPPDNVDMMFGEPSIVTVRIIDSSDAPRPPPPIITRPGADAMVSVVAGSSTVVTGVAAAETGVQKVEVMHDGQAIAATLTTPGAARTVYSAKIAAIAGVNGISVRSTDARGVVSPESRRSFSVRLLSPLRVRVDGTMGSVTPGFAGTTLRVLGAKYTISATPKKKPVGAGFSHWTVEHATLAQLDVSEAQLFRPTLEFRHAPNLILTAHFARNPFQRFSGTYLAQILDRHGDDVARRDNASTGFFTVTVGSAGAFSGRIWFDGQVYPVSGSFGPDRRARFSPSRSTVLPLPRPGKPPLMAQIALARTPWEGCLCTIKEASARVFSSGMGRRAVFDGVTRFVPAAWRVTGDAPAEYTSVIDTSAFEPHYQYPAEEIPQRADGFGNATVFKDGRLTYAGMLPDGTPVTASTRMTEEGACPFFVPLYEGKGHFTASLYAAFFEDLRTQLDSAGATESEVSGQFMMASNEGWWVRPALDTQHYPKGWPAGVGVRIGGTKYQAVAGESIFYFDAPGDDFERGLVPMGPQGNMRIEAHPYHFQGTGSLAGYFNLNENDLVDSIVPFGNLDLQSLAIDRATGRFTGQFKEPSDGTFPTFHGIVVQEKSFAVGRGFFLTVPPEVKDGTGTAGAVHVGPLTQRN
jgi:hypothetical protein